MEYKVGDIVKLSNRASGHGSYDTINNKVVKILNFIVKYDENRITFKYKGENEMTSLLKIERLATLEEIEQYVKENNTPIEEILEICKDRFPIGSKYIGAFQHKPFILCNSLDISKSGVYERTKDYLYYEGKFARLVEESNTEELPFKVGDKFSIDGLQNKDYIIDAINFTERKIKLKCHASFLYTIEEVTRYFEKGTWKLELSTLKKEDFCNTKIDVSKSPELSKLVQEKLIELGFNWRVLSGVNYLYIDNGRAVQYGTEVSAFKGVHNKQIYPQDLGININNKQTINNGNKKQSKESYTGKSIEIQRPIATITTGQRKSGSGVSGRRCPATISIGHLSNKEVNSF